MYLNIAFQSQFFIDSKTIRSIGGKGGNGCISFLRLWCNENAGPDGGDGGNGGHVVFQASNDVKDLNHMTAILRGEDGVNGQTKDCHGKNANHTIIKVPLGTIIKNHLGKVRLASPYLLKIYNIVIILILGCW